MKKTIKNILLALLAVLVIIQFIRPDHSIPEYDANQDFMVLTSPPEEIKSVLKSACYDCHSYHTKYPWYDKIAPVSYWLDGHVDNGRKHLNFSLWGTYNEKRSDHKLEECVEMVEERSMPLKSYTWTHADARLSSDQRATLAAYFQSLR